MKESRSNSNRMSTGLGETARAFLKNQIHSYQELMQRKDISLIEKYETVLRGGIPTALLSPVILGLSVLNDLRSELYPQRA